MRASRFVSKTNSSIKDTLSFCNDLIDAVKWTKSEGHCLDCDGKDQETGTLHFGNLNEAQCLAKCESTENMKGCEHEPPSGCTVHTSSVSKGSGSGAFNCFTLPTKPCPGMNSAFCMPWISNIMC